MGGNQQTSTNSLKNITNFYIFLLLYIQRTHKGIKNEIFIDTTQCLDLKENIQFIEIKSIKLFYWGATLLYGKLILFINILADR